MYTLFTYGSHGTRYAGFDSFHDLGAVAVAVAVAVDRPSDARDDGHYHRATIDLAARTLRSERISERRCEFPTVAPGSEGQEHALGYAVFDEPSAVGSIPDGPVARIWLDHHVPLTFHRAFARG